MQVLVWHAATVRHCSAAPSATTCSNQVLVQVVYNGNTRLTLQVPSSHELESVHNLIILIIVISWAMIIYYYYCCCCYYYY